MKIICLIAWIAMLVTACDIPDKERCGKNYIYKKIGANSACYPVDAGNTGDQDGAPPKDNGADGDGDAGEDGGDGGDASPTGMGVTCKEQGDCAGYDADYCAINPTTQEGGCTIQDCTLSPDSCPKDWKCCDFPEAIAYPVMCIPQDEYDQIGSTMCHG